MISLHDLVLQQRLHQNNRLINSQISQIKNVLSVVNKIGRISDIVSEQGCENKAIQLLRTEKHFNQVFGSNESLATDLHSQIKNGVRQVYSKLAYLFKVAFDERIRLCRSYVKQLSDITNCYVNFLVKTDNSKLPALSIQNVAPYDEMFSVIHGFNLLMHHLKDKVPGSDTNKSVEDYRRDLMGMFKTHLPMTYTRFSNNTTLAIDHIHIPTRTIRFVDSKWDNVASMVAMQEELIIMCNKIILLILALDTHIDNFNSIIQQLDATVTKNSNGQYSPTTAEQFTLYNAAAQYHAMFEFDSELTIRATDMLADYKLTLDVVMGQVLRYKKQNIIKDFTGKEGLDIGAMYGAAFKLAKTSFFVLGWVMVGLVVAINVAMWSAIAIEMYQHHRRLKAKLKGINTEQFALIKTHLVDVKQLKHVEKTIIRSLELFTDSVSTPDADDKEAEIYFQLSIREFAELLEVLGYTLDEHSFNLSRKESSILGPETTLGAIGMTPMMYAECMEAWTKNKDLLTRLGETKRKLADARDARCKFRLQVWDNEAGAVKEHQEVLTKEQATKLINMLSEIIKAVTERMKEITSALLLIDSKITYNK